MQGWEMGVGALGERLEVAQQWDACGGMHVK